MNFSTWPRPLYVVDVEGNGASPPDLVEIALISIEDGDAVAGQAHQWLIQPPGPIPPRITRIHGITTAMTKHAPRWPEVAPQVLKHLEGAWIAAHSAHVEYNVLTRHLPSWQPAGVIDTLRLAKHADPGHKGYGLDLLISRVGLDLSGASGNRHRAAYDAYATALLLLHLAEHYPAWDALAAAAVPPGMPGHRAPDPKTTEEPLW